MRLKLIYLKKNHCTCDKCDTEFEKAWTNEEAIQEARDSWTEGYYGYIDLRSICDACFWGQGEDKRTEKMKHHYIPMYKLRGGDMKPFKPKIGNYEI